MVDKVVGGDGRRKILAVEMGDNGYNGDGDTGRWIQRRRIRGTGDKRDAG